MVTWSCLGFVPINLDILGVMLDSMLTFENHVRGIVSRVSQRNGILSLVKRIFVNTSVLLHCGYAFNRSPILENCSPVWGTAAECYIQFHERQVYSVARLYPYQSFVSLCQRHVAWLFMLVKLISNTNQCLFSELPSAATRVRHPELRPSSSIGVWRIKVLNVPFCKVFPAGPGWNVECPSIDCVWHWNAISGLGCSQPLVAARDGLELLWNVIDYITHYMLKIVF